MPQTQIFRIFLYKLCTVNHIQLKQTGIIKWSMSKNNFKMSHSYTGKQRLNK